ncbi:hypothetical protein CDAR_413661 [Caerostris darwini]|uniref:Uncharacterized protein n=1 Tax=Caerostris darwini TaxID=1538125 RepID=A0AAV4SD90_9ARAC|nr:hypothetical protein CDAR_413661 [Caerostris darwini]
MIQHQIISVVNQSSQYIYRLSLSDVSGIRDTHLPTFTSHHSKKREHSPNKTSNLIFFCPPQPDAYGVIRVGLHHSLPRMETTVMRGLTYQIFGVQEYFFIPLFRRRNKWTKLKCTKERKISRQRSQSTLFSRDSGDHPFLLGSSTLVVTARDDSFTTLAHDE